MAKVTLIPESFRSRLGRKLSLVFLLSALLPLVSVSWVIYEYTSHFVQEQREKDLNREAKLFELLVRERLIFLAEIIASPNAQQATENYFLSVLHRELATDPSENTTSPEKASLSLILSDTQNLVISSFDPGLRSQTDYTVNPAYLFGNLSVLSIEFDYCVFGLHSVLYCDGALDTQKNALQTALKHDRFIHRNTLYKTEGHEALLYVSRQLFLGERFILGEHFKNNNWQVVASQSMEKVLEPIVFFQNLFLAALGLTLVLIAALSSRQITRLMTPLRALTAAAQRFADHRFSEPVKINSGDELEDVANAFNLMSQRISASFHLLHTLADIDQKILNSHDTIHVSQLAWTHLREIFPTRFLCVATLNPENAIELHCYLGNGGQNQPSRKEILSPKNDAFASQSRTPTCFAKTQLQSVPSAITDELQAFDFPAINVIPILIDKTWNGFIAIEAEDASRLKADAEELLSGLADRIAVAITNERKGRELYKQAHFDFLTQLPNRKLLRDRLMLELRLAKQLQTRLAVVFIDLDNFKQVNDSLGHMVGDQLLLEVSARLSEYLGEKNMVAREGGDEFIMLLPNIADASSLTKTLIEIQNLFKDPIFLEGHFIYASLSLGVAMYPEHGHESNTLLTNADTALYQTKAKGKAGFLMYQASMNETAKTRLELETDFWQAIKQRQLLFYYQPLINVKTQKVGFEALIRWQHPQKGLLAPGAFIEIAEETGLILQITSWMFNRIFSQVNQWRHEDALDIDKVAINISPLQLLAPEFLEHLQNSLQAHNMSPTLIEFEITEGVFLENRIQAEERLKAIEDMGISLALDDFGTGYSSLSYLQQLPFKRLKIDRSFVSKMQANSAAPPLVEAIINMAHSLQLNITAEGVEEAFQFAMLQDLGCDVLQGYHIAAPIAPKDCADFVRHYRFSGPKSLHTVSSP